MHYKEKLSRLREQKIIQTQQKLEYEGYLDEDDYGRVVPTFAWHIIPNHEDGNFYGIEGWTENFCDLMEKHDTFIDEDDAFTGRWMYFMSKMRPTQYNPKLLPEALAHNLKKYESDAGIGFDAHFCPDYGIGLELGWGGLLHKIETYQNKNAHDTQTYIFYDCHKRVIKSIQGWIQKHINALDALIQSELDPAKKQELQKKKEVNTNILYNPPKTYREALQWILWFHMASRTFNRDGAGGQLDTLLFPYYQQDMESGTLSKAEATYLMGCFLINDPVYWQIGGPDTKGIDQTNELSFLILDAAELINVSLNITVRVHDGLDQNLLQRAIELLITYKKGWPRFSGDKALVKGFSQLGFSPELARERIATGCNWMSLPGKEYTVNDLFKVNMAKVFEVAWQEMMDSCGYPGLTNNIGQYKPVVMGNKRVFSKPSTCLLWEIFEKHLSTATHSVAESIRFHLSIMKDNEVELLLNLLSHGPIEKGKDISDGGALYYNLAIDGAGLGTVADSFAALELRIEQENITTWSTVNHMLRTNWTGISGKQAQAMMHGSSPYGGTNTLGNIWADKISKSFTKLVLQESDNDKTFIPGLFSWAKPHILGSVVGATPDGRRFGDPITHGANPNPGFVPEAAALAQSTAIARVQPGYGNTAPLQLEFDPFLLNKNPEAIIKALILSHFELGGTLVNINIIDKETLMEAHLNPERFPDLVVRVTGFTAFFSLLTPEFRQVLIDRIVSN